MGSQLRMRMRSSRLVDLFADERETGASPRAALPLHSLGLPWCVRADPTSYNIFLLRKLLSLQSVLFSSGIHDDTKRHFDISEQSRQSLCGEEYTDARKL